MYEPIPSAGTVGARADEAFAADVLRGLSLCPRSIDARHARDARGWQLVERLADVPEHYLVRAGREIVEARAERIAASIGPDATLVELEPEHVEQSRALLERLRSPARYVPIGVDRGRLRHVARELARTLPRLRVDPLATDPARTLPWLAPQRGRCAVVASASALRRFAPDEAAALLRRLAALAGPGGLVLAGADLRKPPHVVEAAYADRSGVCAALARNLLVRINREIGATFDVTRFRHEARYEPVRGVVETRLVSDRRQRVQVAGRPVDFQAGEWVVTGRGYTLDVAELAALARRSGLVPGAVWTDAQGRVSLQELTVAPSTSGPERPKPSRGDAPIAGQPGSRRG